jgi:predicted transcriptional regulator
VSNVSKNAAIQAIANIAAAYASKNELSEDELFKLIKKLKDEFDFEEISITSEQKTIEPKLNPAIPIEKCVEENRVYCLECGKSMTMLKRHLRIAHNLTPTQYLRRWNLPDNFPLTAPSYSDKKAKMAKESDLGKYNRFNKDNETTN